MNPHESNDMPASANEIPSTQEQIDARGRYRWSFTSKSCVASVLLHPGMRDSVSGVLTCVLVAAREVSPGLWLHESVMEGNREDLPKWLLEGGVNPDPGSQGDKWELVP